VSFRALRIRARANRTGKLTTSGPLRASAFAIRQIGKQSWRSDVIRRAIAVWRGGDRDGGGTVSTGSGVLIGTPYSFRARFENEKGTNPEELIVAAHAGCFSMTMAFVLQGAGYKPAELSVEAAVTIEPKGEGFEISQSALVLRAQVPGLDQAAFAQMVDGAGKSCPVSRVLNAEITVDTNLIST
jgi:osmotically inducible protein OsmC